MIWWTSNTKWRETWWVRGPVKVVWVVTRMFQSFPPQQRKALDNLIIIIFKTEASESISTTHFNYLYAGWGRHLYQEEFGSSWDVISSLLTKVKKPSPNNPSLCTPALLNYGTILTSFFLVLWSFAEEKKKKKRHFFKRLRRCFLGFCLFCCTLRHAGS